MQVRAAEETRFYCNAKIFTGTGEGRYATAFAVTDGRFSWVGDQAEIPEGVEVIDLAAKLVLPGLIDAHTHPTYLMQTMDAIACTPPHVTSIPELVAALRNHPNLGAGEHTWIRGWGYDESNLSERRTPTRHDLDQVSTSQPVYVLRSDCHSGICNTRALELAGVDADSPDPAGGHFGRDVDGTPNGVLVEHAANDRVRHAMGSAGFDADVDALVQVGQHLAARGIVACTDMFCVPLEYRQLDLYRAAAKKGFAQVTRIFYHFPSLAQQPIRHVSDSDRQGRVALGGVKLFMDGSISNRTAWLSEPYPGTDSAGMRTSPRVDMIAALNFARSNRLQLAFHAMGDRAVEEVLDVYEDENPWLDDCPSVRIEHASVLRADLLERLANARMRFGVVTNIDFFFAEYEAYANHLSEEQFARCYPVRELYEGVEPLALASDNPATTWAEPDNMFLSVQAAVTRRAHNNAEIVADQALNVEQALLLLTGRAHLVSDMPDQGRIAVGCEANFIAVDTDVCTCPPDEIADTVVTGTWIAGEQVHSVG